MALAFAQLKSLIVIDRSWLCNRSSRPEFLFSPLHFREHWQYYCSCCKLRSRMIPLFSRCRGTHLRSSTSASMRTILLADAGREFMTFFPIVVQLKGKKVQVPMLFDTGSPYTFLRRETLAALGIRDDVPLGSEVKIHGLAHQIVYESKGHFSNVDILGQDFIVANDMEVRVAGKRLRAVLDYAHDVDDDDDGVENS
eukprot:gene30078-36327_t